MVVTLLSHSGRCARYGRLRLERSTGNAVSVMHVRKAIGMRRFRSVCLTEGLPAHIYDRSSLLEPVLCDKMSGDVK
jgi:hypothetical protein